MTRGVSIRLALLSFLAVLLTGCTSAVGPPPQSAGAASLKEAKAITALPTPVSSPNDTRQYQAITLGNGLRVVLIEDPQQDVSAASLSVSVGSLDDPPSRPGLAHFLEHMLFLGTRRYPAPDAYNSFMAQHGGQHNAYTASDHTNYFFEVPPAAFGEALARFGQFFVAPILNAIYVDKERHAVHSEYQLHLKDDRWRIYAAQRVAVNPEHPASWRFIGSLETLSDEQGAVREDLLAFYAQHYKASRMVLVLSSKHALKRQLGWVRRHFSGIPSGNAEPTSVLVPMFKPDQLPALLEVRPERELRTLNFSFPLPPTHLYYRTKPAQYIASLLGHEGEGSLYADLKDKGWIESLITSAGNIWRQDAALGVNIQLTAEGEAHWREVGDAVFAAIRLLRQSSTNAEWRFAEESLLSSLAFQYGPRTQPINYVAELSANAFKFPMTDLIQGPYLMDTYAPGLVMQYLSLLTPDRVLVTRVAPELETDSIEQHFGVDYKLGPVSAALQNRWAAALAPPELRLPQKNTFLPQNLGLVEDTPFITPTPFTTPAPAPEAVPAEMQHSPSRPSVPRRLDTDRASVWHSSDTSFGIPEAKLTFRLRNPNYTKLNAAQQAMLGLYIELVDDALKTFVYPAFLAGLGYGLYSKNDAVQINISGYNDRQAVLLAEVMRLFNGLRIDPVRFEILKVAMLRKWRNALKADPYALAMSSLGSALREQAFRPEQLIAALQPITPEQLADWMKTWRAELGLNALVVGNVTEAEALRLTHTLADSLPGVFPDNGPTHERLASLAGGGGAKEQQVDHSDAALVVYVQGEGQTLVERAHYGLLSQIFRTDYFNELRTEQQLGYVVSASSRTWVNTPGILFITQSPTASAPALYRATQAFLQSKTERFTQLKRQDLRHYKQAVIARLLERDKNLADRSGRYWADLLQGNTAFNTRIQLAAAVSAISKKSLIQAFYDFRARFARNTLIVYSKGKFDAEWHVPDLAGLTDEDFDNLHSHARPFRYPLAQ